MAEITAALVAKLRAQTGAGMMECKKALVETQGDVEAAVDLLRKKGSATSEKKAAKEAREGVIAQYIAPGAKRGLLVEVNCQTDFVARNESFQAFAGEVARLLVEQPDANLEALREEQVARIGENIRISRHEVLEVSGTGLVAAYIHHGAKIGVLVEVSAGQEATLGAPAFQQFVKDIALQVTAASPSAVSREELDPAVVAKEREIAAEQVKDKPAQVIEKIVTGKLEKYFQGVCLVDQGFIKRNAEVTVKEHLESLAKELGDTISVKRFLRFQVGEVSAE
ncbi:MAG: translation elongation factor Ts [Verrucomicrobiota bacterium]|jgi:elongation factor Ts